MTPHPSHYSTGFVYVFESKSLPLRERVRVCRLFSRLLSCVQSRTRCYGTGIVTQLFLVGGTHEQFFRPSDPYPPHVHAHISVLRTGFEPFKTLPKPHGTPIGEHMTHPLRGLVHCLGPSLGRSLGLFI